MASNPFFSGRIPPELHKSVEKHCLETGKSKTEVLIEALSSYLNLPATTKNDQKSEVTRQMYDSLIARIDVLEKNSVKTTVINDDNNNKNNKIIVKVIPQQQNEIKQKNNLNIKDRNKPIATKEKPLEENYTDSKNIKRLSNKEVAEKANVSISQMTRFRNFVIKEAEIKGYEVKKNSIFPKPIEAIQKLKKIIIEGKKYKLLCFGFDNKFRPIWELEIDDNSSYQLDIIS